MRAVSFTPFLDFKRVNLFEIFVKEHANSCAIIFGLGLTLPKHGIFGLDLSFGLPPSVENSHLGHLTEQSVGSTGLFVGLDNDSDRLVEELHLFGHFF